MIKDVSNVMLTITARSCQAPTSSASAMVICDGTLGRPLEAEVSPQDRQGTRVLGPLLAASGTRGHCFQRGARLLDVNMGSAVVWTLADGS